MQSTGSGSSTFAAAATRSTGVHGVWGAHRVVLTGAMRVSCCGPTLMVGHAQAGLPVLWAAPWAVTEPQNHMAPQLHCQPLVCPFLAHPASAACCCCCVALQFRQCFVAAPDSQVSDQGCVCARACLLSALLPRSQSRCLEWSNLADSSANEMTPSSSWCTQKGSYHGHAGLGSGDS